MLNELYALATALSAAGIETESRHKDYLPIPSVTQKAPCIRLWLAKSSDIDHASEAEKETAAATLKFGHNQATFPAFNIPPLYKLCNNEQISMCAKYCSGAVPLDIDRIRSWCAPENCNGNAGTIDKRMKRAITKANELLTAINAVESEAQNVVTELIALVNAYSSRSFRAALEECIFRNLEATSEIALYLNLLFGTAKNISIALDVEDWEEYEYPIMHKRTTQWINHILLTADGEKEKPNSPAKEDTLDAFGDAHDHYNEPMPKVKLSGINVILRSMFHEHRCQYRYGKISNGSFAINKANRTKAKDALEWIALDKHRGKTWESIDKNEILFAYSTARPEAPCDIAAALTPSRSDDPERAGMSFADITEELTASLRGIVPKNQPNNISIFTIRKMDKARTKVTYNRNCSAEHLISCAEHWQAGCENIPALNIRTFEPTKKGRKASKMPVLLKQITPFPLQVPRVLNSVWKRDGTRAEGKSAVIRMHYFQGMELLLDPPDRSTLTSYLQILLMHSVELVQYAGNSLHKGLSLEYTRATALSMTMSTFGLLLYKLGYMKGDYMKDAAYQIGQLLKAADELHAVYCKVVRDGSIPPQLIGSSLFVAVCESPIQGLSQMSVRIKPYLEWAKQYRTRFIATKGEESWRVAWILNLLEDIASDLGSLLSPSLSFRDYDKAMLMIGYLAAFPKREKDADPEDISNT